MKQWPLTLRQPTRDVLVLLTLGGALWLTSVGMWDLRGPDEGRYVQIAKELLHRSNWIHLTVHGEPYDQKPPLAFWLLALMLKLSGGEVISWALRLPSVIAAMATSVLTYLMGRHSFNRETGFLGALMLISCPLFFDNAATAELNMLYTALIAGSLWAWVTRPQAGLSRARAALFWSCLAAAFFVKGPLAFVVVLSAVAWDVYAKRDRDSLRTLRPLAGVSVVLLLIGGWLFAQSQLHGVDFVSRQVHGETVTRILAGDHGASPWYYFPRIFTSIMFPWPFVAIALVLAGLRGQGAFNFRGAAAPYLGSLVVTFLLLCLVSGKRQTYLLPLLPAACILLSAYFTAAVTDRPLSRKSRLAWLWAGVILGTTLVAGGIWAAYRPEYVRTDAFWMSSAGMAFLILAGFVLIAIAVMFYRSCGRWRNLFYGYAAVAAVFMWGDFVVIRPAMDPVKSTRYLSNVINASLGSYGAERPEEAGTVAVIGSADLPELHVYGHYVPDHFQAKAFLSQLTNKLLTTLRVVIVKADNRRYNELAASLANAGFSSKRRIEASKEDLLVFEKPSPSDNSNDGKLRFFLVGDTGSGKQQITNVVDVMARRAGSEPVDGVFVLGDIIYKGLLAKRSVQRYFVEPFSPLLEQDIPVYGALGNHDYKYDRLRGETESPYLNMGGQRYYSLDFGTGPDSLSVFVCDSESLKKSDDTEQLEWLSSAIAASSSKWKILVIHRPFGATDVHHGSSKKLRRLLNPIIKDVDVVFAGHNHLYERRTTGDGVMHVTAGAGGQLTTNTLTQTADREAGYNDSGSFVELTIDDGSLTVAAWNEKGEQIDKAQLGWTAYIDGTEKLDAESITTDLTMETQY